MTLPLALFNLIPVACTALGLFFLARLVDGLDPASRDMAWLGGVLVVLAGLAKASWKLILVVTGADLTWLANALFPLMAPGLALVAAALMSAFARSSGRDWSARARALVGLLLLLTATLVLIRTLGLGIPRGWFLPLLGLASLANLTMSLLLIANAWRRGRRGLAALFGVNLAMVFALPPIALVSPTSLALHWLEQGLTALGTAAFALGAHGLLGIVRSARAGPLGAAE